MIKQLIYYIVFLIMLISVYASMSTVWQDYKDRDGAFDNADTYSINGSASPALDTNISLYGWSMIGGPGSTQYRQDENSSSGKFISIDKYSQVKYTLPKYINGSMSAMFKIKEVATAGMRGYFGIRQDSTWLSYILIYDMGGNFYGCCGLADDNCNNVYTFQLDKWLLISINSTGNYVYTKINDTLICNSTNVGGFNVIEMQAGHSSGDLLYYTNLSIDDIRIANLSGLPEAASSDITSPVFSDLRASANTTYIYGDSFFNVTITESNPAYYKFFWNYSGVFVNDSAVSYTTAAINITKTLNLSFEDKTVCFGFWANDTSGNSGSSNITCFKALNNYTIKGLLINIDYSISPNNLIEAYKTFYIGNNYTKNKIQITTGLCEFTAENITAHLHSKSGNKTLNSVNLSYSYNFNEKPQFPTTFNNDTVSMFLCRIGSPVSANIYINSTLLYTVPSSVIAVCTNNQTHYSIYKFNQYINKTNYNVTVQCNGCTASKELRIIESNISDTLVLGRFLTNHTEDYAFNTTKNIYFYGSHLYQYDYNKTNNILIKCNDTSYNYSVISSTSALVINLNAINDNLFSNTSVIESSDSYDVRFEISGGLFSYLQINLTNSSGVVLYTANNTEEFVLNSSILNYDGKYMFKVYAYGISESMAYYEFNITDTILPGITFNFPASDNSSTGYKGSFYTSDIFLYDYNLYGYNYSIYSDSGTQVYSIEAINIGYPGYTISQAFQYNNTGNYTHTVTAYDSHTDLSLSPFNVAKTNKSLIFDSVIISAKDSVDTHTIQYSDKYDFRFIYDKNLPNDLVFTVESIYPIIYLPDSNYTAHFIIWAEKKWVDFSGYSGQKPLIYRNSEFKYTITFQNLKITDNTAVFNSIGGLNSFTASSRIEINEYVSKNQYSQGIINGTNWFNTDAINTGTQTGVLMYFFILFVIIGLIVLAEVTRIPVIMILCGFIGVIFGVLVWTTIAGIIGAIICVISILYIIRGFI